MRQILFFLAAMTAWAADAPQFTIANGNVRATLFIPDAATGYYQATRFDWSGAMASLEWKGHSYFGKWFEREDPKIHDAVSGPVEEFAPLGYEDAPQGGNFVKIGVGTLVKPAESGYQQFKTYEIADPGRWIVITAPEHIDFQHYLNDPSGFAYEYRKTVRLTANGFVLEHALRNTGSKPIRTNVYEHNFYMLDKQASGPPISVKLPFAPRAAANLRGLAETRGNEIVFLKELLARETVQSEIAGFSNAASDYDIRVENQVSGAGVRQTSDRPMSKLVFWSARTTVCPEAYIDVSVEPGQETSWRIRYEFYAVDKR